MPDPCIIGLACDPPDDAPVTGGGTYNPGGGSSGGSTGGGLPWVPTYGEPVDPGEPLPEVCVGLDCLLPGGFVYVSPGVSRYGGTPGSLLGGVAAEAGALLRGQVGVGQLSPLTVLLVAGAGAVAVALVGRLTRRTERA